MMQPSTMAATVPPEYPLLGSLAVAVVAPLATSPEGDGGGELEGVMVAVAVLDVDAPEEGVMVGVTDSVGVRLGVLLAASARSARFSPFPFPSLLLRYTATTTLPSVTAGACSPLPRLHANWSDARVQVTCTRCFVPSCTHTHGHTS